MLLDIYPAPLWCVVWDPRNARPYKVCWLESCFCNDDDDAIVWFFPPFWRVGLVFCFVWYLAWRFLYLNDFIHTFHLGHDNDGRRQQGRVGDSTKATREAVATTTTTRTTKIVELFGLMMEISPLKQRDKRCG